MSSRRRPPNMIAEIGTPSGASQSGSIVGHCAAGAVKRPLGCAAGVLAGGGPWIAAPVQRFGRWNVRHAFPPDVTGGLAALRDQGDVGEDAVGAQRCHGVGIGLFGGAGSDAEEACLGIDGAELAGGVRLDPGDVVADRPDLPTIKAGRGNQHGEVRLAAGRWKGCGDIGLFGFAVFILWAFDSDDEHVLGHPAFVARDVAGNAQGEALFAEQRVAAVTGAVAPDFARFGEVDDVLGVVLRPWHVGLAGRERRSNAVDARHHALVVLVDFGVDRQADAGHDAHVHHGIGGVSQLHANLCHGRADRAHAERHHVHGAAAHAALEDAFSACAA